MQSYKWDSAHMEYSPSPSELRLSSRMEKVLQDSLQSSSYSISLLGRAMALLCCARRSMPSICCRKYVLFFSGIRSLSAQATNGFEYQTNVERERERMAAYTQTWGGTTPNYRTSSIDSICDLIPSFVPSLLPHKLCQQSLLRSL